jgi:phage-related protein
MPWDSSPWTVLLYPPGKDWGCVAEFIEGLPAEQQARIAKKFELLEQYGPFNLGVGHVAPVHGARNRVYELRVLGKSSFRFFFTCVGHVVVILHGVQKKSQRLHKKDIEAADRRAAEVHESCKEPGG